MSWLWGKQEAKQRPLPTPRLDNAASYGNVSSAGAPPHRAQGSHAAYNAQNDVTEFQQMPGHIVEAPGGSRPSSARGDQPRHSGPYPSEHGSGHHGQQHGYSDTGPRLGPKHEGEIRILIIGKTGNGKSTLGNILLDANCFQLARGMLSATRATDIGECTAPDGKQLELKVIDTPDISNVGMRDSEKQVIVSYWRGLDPDAILLAVRCDVRYTPEEYSIFQELRKLWGDDNSFLSRLLVAFTFGDRLDNDIEEEIRKVRSKNKELSAVMNLGCEYFVFSRKAEQRERMRQRDDLLAYAYSRRTSTPHVASTVQQPPQLMDMQEAPRKEMTSSSSSTLPGSRVLRVLILGKSGNGKSTVGNILLGEDAFTVSKGMVASTKHAHNKSKEISRNTTLEVIDTPDIFNLSLKQNERPKDEISVWKNMTKNTPDAILLAVRCDVRYTPEEYAIYRELRILWGDDNTFLSRLVVAFTFSDRLDNNIEEELRKVNSHNTELSSVLSDARGRYLLFSDRPQDGGLSMGKQRDAFMNLIESQGRSQRATLGFDLLE